MVRTREFLDAIRQNENIYVDTNILIYLLENKLPYSDLVDPLFEMICRGEVKGHTSSFTILELSVGPYQRGEESIALNYVAGLKVFPYFYIHDFSLNMADEGARLRARYKLPTPDAIHVGCALGSQCQILLGNDRGFKKIKEISYLHLDDFVGK